MAYSKTKDIDGIISTLIDGKEYHETLKETKARIGVLFFVGEKDDQVLRHHGQECYAYIKPVGLRERALGMPDAMIVVDKKKWEDLGEETQTALIDHELYHIFVPEDASGALKRDDLNRPVFRIRPHDVEIGWFRRIAEEHGEAALEVRQARALVEADGQIFFAFMGKMAKGKKKADEPPAERPGNVSDFPSGGEVGTERQAAAKTGSRRRGAKAGGTAE